jgi:dihydroorotase
MPNLKPRVTTVAQAETYRNRICAALPEGSSFEPLMTLYLTDNTPATEIDAAQARRGASFVASSSIPAGATTNSDAGVSSLSKCTAALARMETLGMPLLVHGEVTDSAVDIFDREAVFIDTVMQPLLRDFPGLRVVFEHITTRDAAQFVSEAGPGIAATITAHTPVDESQCHFFPAESGRITTACRC